jgi:hypothetical protein
MSNIDTELQLTRPSTERIIELVRMTRNDHIQEFLQDNALQHFFAEHYHVEHLSPIKLEFLKRDLKVLSTSSVDLVHYASVIKDMKESNTLTITAQHELFFFQELESIFKKYIF